MNTQIVGKHTGEVVASINMPVDEAMRWFVSRFPKVHRNEVRHWFLARPEVGYFQEPDGARGILGEIVAGQYSVAQPPGGVAFKSGRAIWRSGNGDVVARVFPTTHAADEAWKSDGLAEIAEEVPCQGLPAIVHEWGEQFSHNLAVPGRPSTAAWEEYHSLPPVESEWVRIPCEDGCTGVLEPDDSTVQGEECPACAVWEWQRRGRYIEVQPPLRGGVPSIHEDLGDARFMVECRNEEMARRLALTFARLLDEENAILEDRVREEAWHLACW